MREINHVTLWNNCLQIIKDNIPEQAFNAWFLPIKPLSYEGETLTLEVPSPFFYEYLENKFLGVLRTALQKGIGPNTILMYKVQAVQPQNKEKDEESKGAYNIPSTNRPLSGPFVKPKDERRVPSPLETPAPQELDPHLKPSYTFENFIEGSSNKLPRVAAETVAENPGKTAFNPLFIYGPSGLGKTHLANAIGNRIKEKHPEKRVLYVSAHLFQVQYTNSVRNNTVNDFISFYQTIDVLIIDDVQEFASLTKTQYTFFHIFNHLHQSGKQLVLTSDRSPVMLQGMEDRLLTRFKWGLLAELERPNTELRKNILKNKIYRDGLKISEPVIDFIAENVNESVRDLEGIINSLMAYSVVYNREIDVELAEKVVMKVTKIEKKQITIDNIVAKVCAFYEMDPSSIHSRSRKREVVQARQVAMYLAKKFTESSSSQIGAAIGKKDHATVLHSCKMIKNQLDVDKELRAQVESLESSIKC
jgi:chromosomal replication initiator protein